MVRAVSLVELPSLVRPDDYPKDALERGESGAVGLLLLVSPDGVVMDCRVGQSSGSASLDEASCRIMRQRARFTPGRDAKGTASFDVAQTLISWTPPTGK